MVSSPKPDQIGATTSSLGGRSGSLTASDRIICFAAQTRILTPLGERMVQDLSLGDLVLTADQGLQRIRWIGHRTVDANRGFAPVRVPKAILNAKRDLLVSPDHRLLLSTRLLSQAAAGTEILARAGDLVGSFGITRQTGGQVSYYHLLLDRHELLFAEGVLSESFHPALAGVDGVDPAMREAFFGAMPDLRADLSSYGPTVRPYQDAELAVA